VGHFGPKYLLTHLAIELIRYDASVRKMDPGPFSSIGFGV
jgi:hypothetical protein